jgi:hypothetical protein
MPYISAARPRTFVTDRVRVANPFLISLPGYENLMLGEVNSCAHNDCPRVTSETLPERVQRELGHVAAYASWGSVQRAAVSSGRVLVDAGTEGATSEGEDSTRSDDETWALAMDHLKTKRPRFMYIALNDPDYWAHGLHREAYLQSLRDDDARIRDLEEQLKRMGSYGRNTTVIVTTDHGRGGGDRWGEHCSSLPESADIWLYASGPRVDAAKAEDLDATQLDVRPTVEKLLGLRPKNAALLAITSF